MVTVLFRGLFHDSKLGQDNWFAAIQSNAL